MGNPLWQPDAARKAETQLVEFMAWAAETVGKPFASYDDLHRFSVDDPGRFWSMVWDFCGVVGHKGDGPALIDEDKMPGARFFPEARLNYAENLLANLPDGPAIIFRAEDKVSREMSSDELVEVVAKFQGLIKEVGVGVGDRIAAMMPNMPESIAALAGSSASGAVWSSCSPDFGFQGVLDRFGQVEPKVFVACDGYFYNGKQIDISDKLSEIVASLPTLELVVIVPLIGQADEVVGKLNKELVKRDARAVSWHSGVVARQESKPAFERLPFDHPLYILFSSGTTGVPKCIVHAAGGALLKHLSEHRLHTDVRPGDRVFYFTTLGWMMWNWLVSGLGCGATLLLYDGSPFFPDGNVLWDYVQDEKCTHFGTSAKYIDALSKGGFKPRETHQLAHVRALMSTGSPLVQESFEYVYRDVMPNVHLASISGGTDIVGCFVLGNPIGPVWSGEIQVPALGVAIAVFDDEGKALAEGKGELVCLKPFPSMPVKFWNDPDGEKYRQAYFARFENIWHHGDFAEWTEHGGMLIHGRSDATLNPGGVRIGTAEIYRQVEQLPEVIESIVIGQKWDGDVRVVLFVILQEGLVLDDELRGRIQAKVRTGASPRHVPQRIVQVTDIPRTKSGKITELAVRDTVHGTEIKNKEALANPEAIGLFRNLPELQT